MSLHSFYLHLSSLNGVMIAFPSLPVYTVSVGLVFTVVVMTIQVGLMAIFIPPGTFEWCSTVAVGLIIVTIFGGERHTAMVR